MAGKNSSSSSSSSAGALMVGAEAIEGCIDRLSKERDENPACPDLLERNKVLALMLEFAAAEVSPFAFKAITEEIGDDALQETPFLKAYTLFDLIKNTGGDGDALAALIAEFNATLVNFEGLQRAPQSLLELRNLLLCELKVQVCL